MPPRFTVLSVMAIAMIVALDAATFRAIASRPHFLADALWWPAALTTVPMINVLAFVAAWGRSHRALGFQAAGWVTVVGTLPTHMTTLRGIEHGMEAAGLINWSDPQPIILASFAYLLIPAGFLAVQVAVALLGGRAARWFAEPADRPRRPRWAMAARFVAIAAMPFLIVEVTLRTMIDPLLIRLEPGTPMIVNFDEHPRVPAWPPAGSPLLTLAGTTVQVAWDDATSEPEWIVSTRSGIRLVDRRGLCVTSPYVDGERVILPLTALRPLSPPGE